MSNKQPYHHGNLYDALLKEANIILKRDGVEGLSLRKLGEALGVSRTAAYHHFANKNALLCALAEEGFHQLNYLMQDIPWAAKTNLDEYLIDLVEGYLNFAIEHPARYELMFGRAIWQRMEPTSSLKSTAHDSFRAYAERMQALLDTINPEHTKQPLRVAQATWGMLHGLCRFMLDGIYGTSKDMSSVSQEAAAMLSSYLHP